MGKKILIVGPESTGKSTLTVQLRQHYISQGRDVVAIEEYAREWIDTQLGGDMDRLEFDHITGFGTKQMQLVAEASLAHSLVLSDTDAVTSLIFQRIYYEDVDPALCEVADQETWDLILFTQIDVPWVDDGQRNLSHRREEVCRLFDDELAKRGWTYVEVKGDWQERFHIATQAIDELLQRSFT
jgi:NadR type nicotinamide-nucleotide adenylyltransferase